MWIDNIMQSPAWLLTVLLDCRWEKHDRDVTIWEQMLDRILLASTPDLAGGNEINIVFCCGGNRPQKPGETKCMSLDCRLKPEYPK